MLKPLRKETAEKLQDALDAVASASEAAQTLLSSINDWFLASVVLILAGLLVVGFLSLLVLRRLRRECGRIADSVAELLSRGGG